MYLLETSVKLDFNNLSLEHLLIIVVAILAFVTIILINGFSLKLGEKEINIGGIQRLLVKRDKDTLLKESLKSFPMTWIERLRQILRSGRTVRR